MYIVMILIVLSPAFVTCHIWSSSSYSINWRVRPARVRLYPKIVWWFKWQTDRSERIRYVFVYNNNTRICTRYAGASVIGKTSPVDEQRPWSSFTRSRGCRYFSMIFFCKKNIIFIITTFVPDENIKKYSLTFDIFIYDLICWAPVENLIVHSTTTVMCSIPSVL